jgi:hypothetical protein
VFRQSIKTNTRDFTHHRYVVAMLMTIVVWIRARSVLHIANFMIISMSARHTVIPIKLSHLLLQLSSHSQDPSSVTTALGCAQLWAVVWLRSLNSRARLARGVGCGFDNHKLLRRLSVNLPAKCPPQIGECPMS